MVEAGPQNCIVLTLDLEMEEGDPPNQGNMGNLRNWKRQEMDEPRQPPERNAFLLVP